VPNLLLDICTNIEENITSLTKNENLFYNYYPDSPDFLLSVIDSGGSPPNLYTPIREKSIEFKFRSNTYQEGIDLGKQIIDLYHSFENYQLGSFFIYRSYALTDINYLYSDSKERDEFSLDIAFEIKR
jgi:hypothetical protein